MSDIKNLAEIAARLRDSSESVGGWPIMEEAATALESIGTIQKLDKMLCDAFARRVHVEQALLKMAAGELPLPDAAKCRELAIALGVPLSHQTTSDDGTPGPKILPAPSELHKRLDEWWTEGGDPFERIEQLERYLQSASAAPEGKADLRARIRLRANMIVRDHELQPQIVDVITDAMESVLTPYVQLANRLKAMEATPPAATDGFVIVPRDKLEHLLEYWNGNANERAMEDALNFILDELGALAAAPQSGKTEQP